MLRTRIRAGAISGFIMSMAFATILTAVQTFDAWIPSLAPEFGKRLEITLRVPYAPLLDPTGDVDEPLHLAIARHTILNERLAVHRIAYAFESHRRPPDPARVSAVFLVHLTLFFLTFTYLRRFGSSRTKLMRIQAGVFCAMAFIVVLAKAWLIGTALPEFWIPLGTVPLWCTLSLERRTAFLVNVMLAFMATSLMLFDLPLLAVLITRGLAATLLFTNRKHPRQMIIAGFWAGIVACVVYAAMMVMFNGSFAPMDDLKLLGNSALLSCVGGGLATGILAYALRDQAQWLLGGVSRDKLMELTDVEQPLLRKMASDAPGSWEHARAMANLAEAAAAAIGADTLLTRVGAYYHDLGKTLQPKYFIENLLPGERSPHDDLEPEVSADAIMAHVVQGTKILREGGIPEAVVEFAYTHHGTQVIEYFSHKCKERGNPKHLTDDFFKYPGMKPQTRETAILMLVDSIEAASRTIQPPDHGKFEAMIERIVFTKLRDGQLDDSGLTPADLSTISVRMADTLVNMYHGRIKYPWQKQSIS